MLENVALGVKLGFVKYVSIETCKSFCYTYRQYIHVLIYISIACLAFSFLINYEKSHSLSCFSTKIRIGIN